jgi:nicotinamidase-related amidase
MLALDRTRTAVLAMDLQSDIVAQFPEGSAALLERAATAIAAARAANVPVIHVVVGFRPGYPEVSSRNVGFSAVAGTGRFVTSSPGADITPAIGARPEDIVVVKHRVGAFAGTDLDMILRAKSIDTLVLFGLATSGVVLSTLRHAADADYRIIVVADCCGDRDADVHRVLMEKVFVRQATVVTASELARALAS